MGRDEIEIARHAADHRELLPVLLAEQCEVGADLVEELGDHRRHPVEVARPRRAAQPLADAGDRNGRAEAQRIHDLDRGRPEQRHAFRLEHRGIAGQLPRIGGQVLVRAELQRVDEDRHGDVRGAALRLAHQRQMAFVERAHRRHQRQRTVASQRVDRISQWIKAFDGLHGSSPLD